MNNVPADEELERPPRRQLNPPPVAKADSEERVDKGKSRTTELGDFDPDTGTVGAINDYGDQEPSLVDSGE